MAAPYAAVPPPGWKSELRSVPNIRHSGRYASAPRMGGAPVSATAGTPQEPYASQRSLTPNRYVATVYNRPDDSDPTGPVSSVDPEPRTPSSTGLIRLSLKKPMGIVFEPMYDPNQQSVQRGVRICDLPRTGAAALSRKLQVADELLQINDTTVSRMTFDEIMDFIIEADPESVNLLFRRPRKETLQVRQGVQQKLNAAANKDAPSTVKWVDEARGDKKKTVKETSKREKKKERSKGKRSKKDLQSEEEETLQSSTGGEESYAKSRNRKKSKSRQDPFESESFLDLLIDTICSNSNNVCRDTFRRNDEEYFSEDDESFDSKEEDESTYVTFEESVEQQKASKHNRKKGSSQEYDEATEEDTLEEKEKHRRHKKSSHKEKPEKLEPPIEEKKYEDDGTLETVDSRERAQQVAAVSPPSAHSPLGLALPPEPEVPQQPVLPAGQSDTDDDGNPAPIKEVEYDDRFDHGADVSVMESLGGPSLLIEKQRAAALSAAQKGTVSVPAMIIESFGLDYPSTFGLTREQSIDADPLKFYTHVVKNLLEEHEPEKVRLLDKLLAKYRGREDHLVQKLSVRYSRSAEDPPPAIPEDHDDVAFSDAVKKSKAGSAAAAAVHTAKERMHSAAVHTPSKERHVGVIHTPQERMHNAVAEPEEAPPIHEWPEKEEKEPEASDEEESESESEYSGDSVDGTSPAVIAQVSELLNYVYGKTSVPGQIDRVSTIMRAYEGREAVLLELLETKALIKANKEKENAENLPSFLRNSQMAQAQKNAEELGSNDLPPVTPLATQPQGGTVINDDISSMSGVSSPARDQEPPSSGIVNQSVSTDEVEVMHYPPPPAKEEEPQPPAPVPVPMKEAPKINASLSSKSFTKPPATPDKDKKKKKGLFGGLFGKKKSKDIGGTMTPGRAGSRSRNQRKLRGVTSIEGSI